MMRNLYTRLAPFPHTASSSSFPRSKAKHEEAVEQVSLAEMNSFLQIMAEMFPEHQVSLLRELLLDASPESRLSMAADSLIQTPERYAHGATRLPPGRFEEWEKFRSKQYRATVEKLLMAEFRGLASSTVRNVVSENNGDYARSREALLGIAAKSWRFNLTAWLTRKPKPASRPLINVLESATGCVRLDEEIYALGKPERDAQSSSDGKLAKLINEEEYTQAQALLECECCFGDFAWEDITACTNGHFFCHMCLDRSVKEALYGQGGCLFREKGTVRCISSVALPGCQGFVASTLLSQVLPAETFDRLEERLARDQLHNSGLQLVRCPACTYAAVDISVAPRLRSNVVGLLVLTVICIVRFFSQHVLVLLTLPISILVCLYNAWDRLYGTDFGTARKWVTDTMARVRRRRMGVAKVFKCQNPRCQISTCIDCGKEWTAFHNCRRETLDSQRLYVERAMSEAVKRTCPQCHMSFVKSGGCNMLTCPCGYEMCYICRADVGGARYRHFCQHFRVEPRQQCTECDRCNLYEIEDERAVANAAARHAAAEWQEKRNANKADGSPVSNDISPHEVWRDTDNKWLFWVEQCFESVLELVFEW